MVLSIVIPVYNTASYLEGCLASVLAGDCTDCEILLVDDGSTDGVSPELCDRLAEAHPDLVQVIHQETAVWVELGTPVWKRPVENIFSSWTAMTPSPPMLLPP